ERWGRMTLGTLHGRTLGLVGLGGIGAAVAERALPFGMRVRACRRTAAPAPIPGVDVVGSLAELVASSDHVVLAAPSTPATRHLFDREVFAAMKPGAHLVNVARGALVEQDALRAALDDGRVAMASLDAVEPEPLPEGHWMYGHPRVRLSPHVSWSMPGAADLLVEIEGDRIAAMPEPDTGGAYTEYVEADVVPGKARYIRRGGIETAINVGRCRYREILVELK